MKVATSRGEKGTYTASLACANIIGQSNAVVGISHEYSGL